MELHARHAFEAGQADVDGNGPLAERYLGVCDWSTCSDAEVGPAIFAPVRHRLCVRDFAGREAAAVITAPLHRPDLTLKPFGCGFLIGKHLEQFNKGETISVGSSWCFLHHECSLRERAVFVKPSL